MALGDLCFCGCFNGTDAEESESWSPLSDVLSLGQTLFSMQTANCCAHNCSAERLASSLHEPSRQSQKVAFEFCQGF